MFLLVTHSCLSLESENLVCFIPISIYVQKKYVMGFIYIYIYIMLFYIYILESIPNTVIIFISLKKLQLEFW